MGQKVAILGASNKPERYAYKAFKMLIDYGHEVYPVTPKIDVLEGKKVYSTLKDLPAGMDTLTMYVGPEISNRMVDQILAVHPKRVIFNPGTENPTLMEQLEASGVEVIAGCTLVMLRTSQF